MGAVARWPCAAMPTTRHDTTRQSPPAMLQISILSLRLRRSFFGAAEFAAFTAISPFPPLARGRHRCGAAQREISLPPPFELCVVCREFIFKSAMKNWVIIILCARSLTRACAYTLGTIFNWLCRWWIDSPNTKNVFYLRPTPLRSFNVLPSSCRLLPLVAPRAIAARTLRTRALPLV